MAPTTDNAPLSDTETSEKPVREQLKKATLAGVPLDENVADASAEAEGIDGGVDARGRLRRKRSFEEVDGEEAEQAEQAPSEAERQHTRKRSRDGAEEETDLNNGKRVSGERAREPADVTLTVGDTNGESTAAITDRPGTPDLSGNNRTEATIEAMASPKTKRSRLHSTSGEEDGTLATEPSAAGTTAHVPAKEIVAEPATNAPESAAPLTETSAANVPPTSGFADTSIVSPFSALTDSKSPTVDLPQTSESAFASSGFGSLAASSSTGFGAIGKSTGGFGAGGGFGSGGNFPLGGETSREKEQPKETSSSGFGGALGQKSAFAAAPVAAGGFGSVSSGFGKLGGSSGGFGSALGGGGFGTFGGASGGLSSFASGKPAAPLAGSSKASKAFGASADDDQEGEEGDDDAEAGYKSPLSQESDKQDDRFYAQHLETGEEDEETAYSCRAKLYNFITLEDGKKEWRERGLGVLRLNVRQPAEDDTDGKPKARFLMRADGSHRVVLNTPVKKEISFGAASGGPPQGGYMLFMGTIEGKTTLELLQLKIKQQYALELFDKVTELQKEM